MVDFGASGCVPCDMMAPILEELQMSLKEKCTILFTDVRIYQVLSARYQISIFQPRFFDREGIEVFRHTDFLEEEILDKLAELGSINPWVNFATLTNAIEGSAALP